MCKRVFTRNDKKVKLPKTSVASIDVLLTGTRECEALVKHT